MDFLDIIYSRRSIRKYQEPQISEDDLKKILKAGFQAPSAHNRQPWEFIVITDNKIKETIAKIHPYAKMLPNAEYGIVVCGDKNKQTEMGFLVADCAAAIENMLLATHSLNYGAVWCGLYPIEKLITFISKIFELPSNIIPIGLIALGTIGEEKAPRDNYDVNKIHFNKW
ncbi:MAG TPA: nitroreductase family protein [Haloplasmataceae bacterium]